MRCGIFSDIHSNLEALEAVIRAYKKESIDKYLCVGDVVGYGANPKECIKKVNSLAAVTIAGNHDWASVKLFSLDYFNEETREAISWTMRNLDTKDCDFLGALKLVYKDETLTLVHGTLDYPRDFNYMTDGYIAEETFRLMQTNICFVGHTHLPSTYIKDNLERILYYEEPITYIRPQNKYIINVGSVGQPRDGNRKASYCIYDTDKKIVQIKRVDYNVNAARKRIIKCGLPQLFGDRILRGK